MSRCNKFKFLFCIQILVGLCNAIVGNDPIFDRFSIEERKKYFGTEDGSIPEYQLVQIASSPHTETLAQNSLSIQFNYFGTATRTTLTKVEDQELVGRNSTGFWFAASNANAYHNVSYTPRPDIFDRIGNIEFYINLDDFSAVTRFWNSSTEEETYTGILKRNYTLKSVPRRFNDGVISFIDRPLVQEITQTFTQKFVIFENPEVSNVNFKISTSDSASHFGGDVLLNLPNRTEPKNSGPIYSPKVVYPKLLLAPSYDMFKNAKNAEDLVQQLIAHLHAVDMVFRQLRDPEIRLHISGIIIPQDEHATPYLVPDQITGKVLVAVAKYFDQEEHRFPYHTYDLVVSLTTKETRIPLENGKFTLQVGMAMENSVCDRVQRFPYTGATLAQHSTDFLGIMFLAHELGHAFNATHDEFKDHCIPGDFIMSEATTPKIFVWSQCSQDAISYYFKTQRGLCAHDKPYSVPDTVKHLPSAWLSQTGQCQNHFKDQNGDCSQRSNTKTK